MKDEPKKRTLRVKNVVLKRESFTVYTHFQGHILTGEIRYVKNPTFGYEEEHVCFDVPSALNEMKTTDIKSFINKEECIKDAKDFCEKKIKEGDKFYSYLEKLDEEYPGL